MSADRFSMSVDRAILDPDVGRLRLDRTGTIDHSTRFAGPVGTNEL